jgi:hypothetical protein
MARKFEIVRHRSARNIQMQTHVGSATDKRFSNLGGGVEIAQLIGLEPVSETGKQQMAG